MHQLSTFATVVFGIGFITSPIMALMNRVILWSELKADAPRSLRQNFWIKRNELTPWGLRAAGFFWIYWLGLAAAFGVALVAASLP